MQSEELDLRWEDESGRGRHRRSARRAAARQARGRGGSGRGRGGRSFVAFLVSLVILGLLVGGGWYGVHKVQDFFKVADYTTSGTGEVRIEVLRGQTSTAIAQTLVEADVVKSAKAFVNAANKNPRSRNIAPGFYQLRHKMRAVDALNLMLDPSTRLVSKVTIPEGKIAKEVFALVSQKTNIPVADFEEAAKDPVALGVPEFWFNRQDGKPVSKAIEGFLFPATYEFPPDATAKSILGAMVKKFIEVTTALDFVNKVQTDRHIAPYQALIAASIAQVEAPLAEDMGKVARVLYNRAYGGKFPCSCLQIDSAVNYWLKVQGKDPKASQELKLSELHNKANPYNTHDVAGFPVGPISNPGEDAFKGAMSPPDGPWLFFVTIDKQGHTAFSVTDAEHEQNKVIARRNGAL